MKLSRALNRLPAAEWRSLLRQAVGVRRDAPSGYEVRLAGTATGSQVDYYAGKRVTTYSFLRDRLPIDILLALVVHELDWTDVLSAFREPATYCRMSSGGGKFLFGWPVKYTLSVAAQTMRFAKRGDYDEHAAKHYSVFRDEPATTPTPRTEKTVNLSDLTIDDVYETFVVLTATKLSILKSQSEADGFEVGADKMLLDAQAIALGLIIKHFGQSLADAVTRLAQVDKTTEFAKVVGTDNEAAGFAVRKIVSEDAEVFRVDAKPEAEPVSEIVLKVKPEFKQLLDLALSQATEGAYGNTDDLIAKVRKASGQATKAGEEVTRLKRLLAAKPVIALRSGASPAAIGISAYPTGTITTVNAASTFPGPDGRRSKYLDFDVPAFDWSGADHPLVPRNDPNYIFKPTALIKFLWALKANKKTWIWGHTGTGKTAFVEQVCARLRWPFFRLNLDSEITRMDLIGRDTLTGDGKGGTISKFIEGILPQAMTLQGHGGMLCVDEVSYGRPDVMYAFQRVLEDKGLLMNEDGGRLVTAGDMFRLVATDNTRGQGDEFGAYQGARPQSAAFLDRYPCWIEFDYLSAKEETGLLMSAVPGLTQPDAEQVANFATEVRTSFKTGQIFQTMTPRASISLAEAYLFFIEIMRGDRNSAIKQAAEATMLSKANDNDKAVIKGIYDRCFSATTKPAA